MINFVNHPSFEKEIKKYKNNSSFGFNNLKNLLSKQFSKIDKELVIGPGKIHKITDYLDFCGELWKVEMSVLGLRPNQWPRVWFLLVDETIYFLHTNTHQNNYDNKESEDLAKERVLDYIF